MHASIEQLLDLRDAQESGRQTTDPDGEAHLDTCSDCRNELSRLASLQKSMRALPEIEPPDGRWQYIVNATSRSRVSWQQPLGWGIAASVLAMVWLAGNLTGRDSTDSASRALIDQSTGSTQPANQSSVAAADGQMEDQQQLIERSRRLASLLRSLPGRPDVIRAGTDSTITSLRNSLAMVDYTLRQPDTALTAKESSELWQHKVNLMDSLVKVRYAEASFASL